MSRQTGIVFCHLRSAPSSSAGSPQPPERQPDFFFFFSRMGVAELENLWLADFDHCIHINPDDLSWLQISTPAPDDWWILTWLCWLHVNVHRWLQVRHSRVRAEGCRWFVLHEISEKKLLVLSLFYFQGQFLVFTCISLCPPTPLRLSLLLHVLLWPPSLLLPFPSSSSCRNCLGPVFLLMLKGLWTGAKIFRRRSVVRVQATQIFIVTRTHPEYRWIPLR